MHAVYRREGEGEERVRRVARNESRREGDEEKQEGVPVRRRVSRKGQKRGSWLRNSSVSAEHPGGVRRGKAGEAGQDEEDVGALLCCITDIDSRGLEGSIKRCSQRLPRRAYPRGRESVG